MKVNTKNLVSITEANQNFSKVARKVDEDGPVVILKNNEPKYILLEFSSVEHEQEATEKDLIEISQRLISQNREAYTELAK
ncbi:type II toxin-antitoxin system prevent-host-death family antitoxin [Enteractinococcus helveticum]|uniref:Antitoxin n=1 Tax=Enteractinococcus helveticum TaxID=1837282 RepID=A0A1B7M3G0_9MICC|nr:type II toxin-antitoxin system prevent-host-death family antitoxin [Enteractinococcus helveticum]OAV63069.1 prevent-host-death protein [Enteractinococcus helveticum]